MEQLRLAGVHDDGEHLIVETPDSTRYRLKIDQQLRQAIQYARRKPPARGRGGASYGPRDIQARFRAGASVDDIVAESGWEPERVRRYEWPILAERSHMVTEACRVKVSGTNPSHDGYRSVFEGEPKSLQETVEAQAARLGVDRSSFDWDAWLREDQLWTVQLSFDPPAERDSLPAPEPARWSYNPATRSVRPDNDWARALGEEPRETGPLGAAVPAAPVQAPGPAVHRLQYEAGPADDLLDVLQARRGRRLGTDEPGDDRLAEMLGRGMGQVEQRPRPIDAPEDSPVFDRPIQPAASQVAEERALRGEGIQIVDDSTPDREDPRATGADTSPEPAPGPEEDTHLDGDETWVEVTQEQDAPRERTNLQGPEDHTDAAAVATLTPRTAGAGRDAAGHGAQDPEESSRDEDPRETRAASAEHDAGADSESTAPGPRGRTPKAKRSSVPSWDDIVFGANRS